MRIQVGHQHLPRAEATAMDNPLRIKVHQACFRSGDYQCIFGEEKAAGAQAIAVKSHPHEVAVGES
jgi:hypothetical protein